MKPLGSNTIKWATLVVFIFSLGHGFTQNSRRALEAKRRRVEREIAESQKILFHTQKQKQNTLSQLTTISRIIEQRTALIQNLQMEVVANEDEIFKQSLQLEILKTSFENEKQKLSKTVKKAYKSRKSGREVAFVFTSKNLKQALRRWKYLRKVSDFKRYQIGQIQIQWEQVQIAIGNLNEVKQQKTNLLTSKEKEKIKLESDKTTKVEMVNQLSKKENELNERIRIKQGQMAKLNRAISNAIAREIEAERRRQERIATRKNQGTSTTKKSKTIEATPETRELSNSFSKNRGILPWPVDRGYVSQKFGVYPHPDFKNITLQNNGIDITTNKDAIVKSVYKGTVSAILSIPGQGEAVLINHGEYFTVYSRLSEVFVQKGEIIGIGKTIGKVMTDEEGKFVLQFQVWLGQEKQNPQNWLKSK
jgi:septal ring factor EnvC (AmiA/AmiB activator)